MRILCFVVAFFFFVNSAYAEDFNIEESTLKVLPKSIESVVRTTKKFGFRECKLIGKTVNLADSEKASDYILTTLHSCGWGASAGPVWVVSKINGVYAVLLETSSYAVEVLKNKNNGLHQIVTTSGTAGHAAYSRWVFNGQNYKETENYVFFPDDEKLCKAHQDICPFEMNN